MKLLQYSISLIFALSLSSTLVVGQYVDRIESAQKRQVLKENSLAQDLEFKNIGPTIFSGRVSDIDVNPNDPTHFLVAYASGGLWYTKNNGTTFEPIFDNEAVITIGDIAADWDSKTIYVGTGEVNSSRSSYAGVGVFKSTDWGKSWTHLGLENTQHIGKVILNPSNSQELWVASLGALYTNNDDRGIYHSTDGGATWDQQLFINNSTGIVDLAQSSSDPKTLYAAAWERSRKAWNFVESGEASGIYKTTDGGQNWTKTNTAESGFPTSAGVGRIGLNIAGDRIYALLDNYDRRPKEKSTEKGLKKDDFKSMTVDAFNKIKEDDLEKYLRSNRFPKKYSAKAVKEKMDKKEITPMDLATYLENANSLLFDTPVIGAELYKSDDDGATWQKTHEGYLDRVYNSYGYYFGLVRANPNNADEVFIAGVPILKSIDGGATFESVNGDNVHADHHSLWISPDRAGHLINGNDGGINISYDGGENWIKCNSPSVGQFYYINVDQADDYNVYGGLQDNGVWMGSHDYEWSDRWHQTGQYPYKSIMGGDGMQIQIDSRDNTTVYTGYQFGNYFRINTKSGKRKYITPRHELGEDSYRWNWQSPIHLSVHNEDILYMGANKLFRSFNQGDYFEAISDDLTTGGQKGDVPYGTLASIHESPIKFGLIYTGSDDGMVYRTNDMGNTWTLLSESLPNDRWVSRIQASAHNESTVYLSLNGYRNDDFESYVYRSDDYGDSWTDISGSLPAEPVNVIKEDVSNENIVYVGTDHGSYVSLNKGETFMAFAGGMPDVPVHDIVVHPTEPHLLIGTHGRSIYLADITQLRMLTDDQNKAFAFYGIAEQKYNKNLGKKAAAYSEPISTKVMLNTFAKSADQPYTVSVYNAKNKVVKEMNGKTTKGLSGLEYDLSFDPSKLKAFDKTQRATIKKADDGKHYLPAGKYKLEFKVAGKKYNQSLNIKSEDD